MLHIWDVNSNAFESSPSEGSIDYDRDIAIKKIDSGNVIHRETILGIHIDYFSCGVSPSDNNSIIIAKDRNENRNIGMLGPVEFGVLEDYRKKGIGRSLVKLYWKTFPERSYRPSTLNQGSASVFKKAHEEVLRVASENIFISYQYALTGEDPKKPIEIQTVIDWLNKQLSELNRHICYDGNGVPVYGFQVILEKDLTVGSLITKIKQLIDFLSGSCNKKNKICVRIIEYLKEESEIRKYGFLQDYHNWASRPSLREERGRIFMSFLARL